LLNLMKWNNNVKYVEQGQQRTRRSSTQRL
jgi:hypothetical protein